MIRVGLTGGYATGKSFVAKELERLGCHVISADRLGHIVLEPEGEAYKPVLARFGDNILVDPERDRRIDRKKLAAVVFGNESLLNELTAIVHPPVYRLEDEAIKQWASRDPDGIAIIEAAILVETGRYRSFDALILTNCDEASQVERGMKRDSLTRDAVIARLRRQLSFDEKKQYADFVIDTGGTEEETVQQVQGAFAMLQTLKPRLAERSAS